MAQNVINIGTIPNDGTGDPLRTAFNETNLNFNQLFAAGPVGSNIQILNNSIITVNNNGNIILAPNGIGKVVTNTDIVPNLSNVRNLGTITNRFNTIYAQYINSTNLNFSGNLTVGGNLTVIGNTVYANTSTLNVANTNINLAVGATDPVMADGGGIFLEGANASMLYDAGSNLWDFNIPVFVNGAVEALSFAGDGGLLTNVRAQASAALLTGDTLANTVLYSSLVSVGTLEGLDVGGNVTISGNLYATGLSGDGGYLSNIQGANVVGYVANATFALTANSALTAAHADTAVTATNASYAVRTGFANVANVATTATYSNLANVASFAYTANAANTATVAFYANNTGTANTANTAITVTGNAQPNITSTGTLVNLSVGGNILTNAILTDGYFYANGAPFIGGGGGNTGVVLGDQQIISDGSAIYTLDQASTSNTALVSLNGVIQAPDTAYTIAGTILTFTANVGVSDLIDIRFLGETGAYPGTYGNANVGAYLPTYHGALNPSSIATNLYLWGNGTPVDFNGNYGNANVADYLPTYNGDLNPSQINTDDYNYANGAPVPFYSNAAVAAFLPTYVGNIGATITDASQPYITSVGTLTGLTVAGNISATNITGTLTTAAQPNITSVGVLNSLGVTGNTRTGNILANGFFYGNGVPFTASNYSNTNVASYLPLYNGNLNPNGIAANAIGTVTLTATGLLSGATANFSGNLTSAANISGANLIASGQVIATGNIVTSSSIRSIGANITGNIAANGIFTNNYYYANGTPIVFTNYGNANVADYLPVYGGNIASGNITNTGSIQTANLFVPGSANITGQLTGGNITANGSVLSATLTTTGNAIVGGNLVVAGNVYYTSASNLQISDPIISIGRGANNTPLTINDGYDRGEQLWYFNGVERSSFIGFQNSTGNMLLATQVSILNNIVTVLSYGNTQVGNIDAFGYVNVTGNILSNNSTANNVTATANVTGNNLTATSNVVATGNVIGGNLVTLGTFFGNNITISANTITNNLVVSSSNITLGNNAGATTQGINSIAIGKSAGQDNQGNGAIAIGAFAGNSNQTANSIIINATGNVLNTSNATPGFYVAPIRATTQTANTVWYNSNTNELTYQPYVIWIDGGDMGTVAQPVTFTQDLGLVTDTPTLFYNLGVVDPVIITGYNIVPGSLSGNNFAPDISFNTTGRIQANVLFGSNIYGNATLANLTAGRIEGTTIINTGGQTIFATFTVSSLPPPLNIGAMVYVSNAPGGGIPAYCDGVHWRSVVDRSIIV